MFSNGAEVKAAEDISGGLLKANVKRGQYGVVTATHSLSGTVDVQFISGGLGYPAVKLTNISHKKLERR